MEPTPVVLVDSNRLFCQGLSSLLQENGFAIVATGSNPEEVRHQGATAEVVLFDAREGMGKAVSTLREACPKARVVLLTDTVDTRKLAEALEAGVDGCMLKDMSSQALAQSIRLVMLGEKVFPSSLATLLVNGGGVSHSATTGVAGRKGLSQREEQILRCLVRGDSNKMVANQLSITEATVKVHLKSLLRKINASNRTQAAIWAMGNGFSATNDSNTAAA